MESTRYRRVLDVHLAQFSAGRGRSGPHQFIDGAPLIPYPLCSYLGELGESVAGLTGPWPNFQAMGRAPRCEPERDPSELRYVHCTEGGAP